MRAYLSWLTVCAVAVLVAGCGGSNKASEPPAATPEVKVVQPGAPGEASREVVATATPKGYKGSWTDADVEFMQDMIHHHGQAIAMTAWVPDRTQSPEVRLLAKRMEVSQQDEIALMERWLENRKIEPGHAGHTDMDMPGMLSQSQLDKLENAKGKAFDRLFLRYMTQHHKGALQMVQEATDKGAGVESEIGQFMLHVDSDQSIEIKRMAELSAKL
jgi:uncharacterized protein (DUF305 family)